MLVEVYRNKQQRYQLQGIRNNQEQPTFPPRPVESRAVETFTFDVRETQPENQPQPSGVAA